MTLIISVQTDRSIWMLADRRLSIGGQRYANNAVKMMSLDAVDGKALIGYSGLGKTALGMEPSQWVSNVLRGRNYKLEESLQLISEAMSKQMPKHLHGVRDISQRQHSFSVACFVNGQHKLYSVRMFDTPNGYSYRSEAHRISRPGSEHSFTTPISLSGSGMNSLLKKQTWCRPLLSLVNAYNQKRAAPLAVCRFLSLLCEFSANETHDDSVSKECIVAWRDLDGGGNQFPLRGRDLYSDSLWMPSISKGIDSIAIAKEIMKDFMPQMEGYFKALEMDPNAPFPKGDIGISKPLNIPTEPDEKLR